MVFEEFFYLFQFVFGMESHHDFRKVSLSLVFNIILLLFKCKILGLILFGTQAVEFTTERSNQSHHVFDKFILHRFFLLLVFDYNYFHAMRFEHSF